jgi:amino acid transporter
LPTGLKKEALGLVHSLAIGVAGAAPSFSISATLATLIGTVGERAPASLFYCGIVMLGIVFAYLHLNAQTPDAGASYAWVSQTFGRNLGFFAGWSLLASSAIFMVSATLPAGSATLLLLAPEWAESQIAVTACALAWLLAVTLLIVKGIAVSGKVQSLMTACELSILALLFIIAIIKLGPRSWPSVSWPDLSPAAFSPASLANGAVIALFLFWGWDVSINLTEETKKPDHVPGIGVVGAMLVIIAVFTGFAVITLMSLGKEEISRAGTNIMFAVADTLLPRPWSYLAILALILSTIGTLATSMLQFSRTLYAQSRDGLLHPRWSQVHDEWRTPHAATFLIAAIGIVLLLTSLGSTGIAQIMQKSINVIGVQAACYYGLAGYACAWRFRHRALASAGAFVTMLVWPATSALVLWWAATMTALSFDWITTLIALGSLLLGFIPLINWHLRSPGRRTSHSPRKS